jgi:hypothetical protein
MTKEEALAKSGWERASAYERSLLLEIFGLEKEPDRIPEVHSPEPFVPAPSPVPAAEIDPELDALVDALVASWTSPKGQASADQPDALTSQTPVPGGFPGRDAETELEASA